jgi:hypothetical protein
MLGREAKTFAKRLAAKLANKWEKSYSQVCGYVNARLNIAIVRATHLCMRGSAEFPYTKSASIILNGKTGLVYHYLNVSSEHHYLNRIAYSLQSGWNK